MDIPGLTGLLRDALPLTLKGAVWTLLLAVASVFFGAIIGTLVAVTRLAKVPVLSQLAALYVSCMRGTPLLVQLFVIYFGLPSLIKDTSLVSVIAVGELMLATKEVIATTFQPFPLYLAVAAIYWAMSASFETLQKKLETRLNRSYLR